MRLHPLDWAVIAVYCVTIVAIGLRFARRAGQSVDEYFLSGRSLPWFLSGTSMVASSFSCDTPLFVTGLVRDHGIWKNWLWWCFLITGMLTVFVFARRWRRGGVMTKAELAELRYGGRDGRLLRGVLGFLHSSVTNTLTLGWVVLAAASILDVLLGVDKLTAVIAACALALTYSLASGLWGVVVTDMPKFWLAMLGSVLLAVVVWSEVGGGAGVLAAAQSSGAFPRDALSFVPPPGPGGPLDAAFWTVPFAAFAVYLGVSWWAVENVDGSAVIVQRLAASRNEREGMLAVLWFAFAHYALRPWPWIMVALASLVLLPPIELTAPVAGVVTHADEELVIIEPSRPPDLMPLSAPGPARVPLRVAGTADDWQPEPKVRVGDTVEPGDVVAVTNSERAYVAMLVRYLPAGLLGLAIVGLMAAFMSTVDTHINLAASFFVNDIWRRFIRPDAPARHHVLVGRLASVGVMVVSGLIAWQSHSIARMFMFFLAFLGGVGPIYVLRWLWWRVRAVHEIVAMAASALGTMLLTFVWQDGWTPGPLAPDGVLSDEGRLCLVVGASLLSVFISMPFVPRPDPAALTAFYRRVQPMGWWGPVAALVPDVRRSRELVPIVVGVCGGLACVWGAIIGTGLWLLEQHSRAQIAAVVAVAGAAAAWWALQRLTGRRSEDAAG